MNQDEYRQIANKSLPQTSDNQLTECSSSKRFERYREMKDGKVTIHHNTSTCKTTIINGR